MATPRLYTEPESSDAKADLHGVLNAWHHATVRLEQTHEMLRQEVRRLHEELESKNRELARVEHLAELGQAAAHVIHDLRSRAEPITMYLSMLRQRLSQDSSCSELIEKLSHAVGSLDVTVNDLVEFTNDRVPLLRRRIAPALGRNAPIFCAAACRSQYSCRTRRPLGSSALCRPRNASPLHP